MAKSSSTVGIKHDPVMKHFINAREQKLKTEDTEATNQLNAKREFKKKMQDSIE